MSDTVIIDAVRTPLGKGRPAGALAGLRPVDLLAHALAALVERTGIDPRVIDDVIAGCVSQIGEQSTNIARRAVLAAGYPERVPATTVDRQCGSAQQAIHFAAPGVLAGAYDVVVAAGVESMSHVPMGRGWPVPISTGPVCPSGIRTGSSLRASPLSSSRPAGASAARRWTRSR